MEKKYKICVYAITKNEEKFVENWVRSMSEADAIYVTDTGSSDNTVGLLKSLGVNVFTAKVEPWRFDAARNISLENVPHDCDICLCTDLDELLKPGWRELIERRWRPETTAGRYLYNWSLKPDGTPDVQFYYTKMHARHAYKWKHPIHECLMPVSGRHTVANIGGMELTHYPDSSKSRGNYLGLLELAVKESPEDDRMMYYLGREYKYKGRWQDCIDTMERYLKLPSATWPEERCAAMRWAAYSYFKLGDYTKSRSWYFKAISEAPHMREPYVEFAQTAYHKKDWQTCFSISEQALKLTERALGYVTMGYAWDYTPYDLSAISAYYCGLYDIAFLRAQQALELAPDNPRLKSNLQLISKKLQKHQLE